ncbi:MAG: Maf family protein [Anaerolineae bacterium]|nr:Maf family protein [Anaerolineae bacterium]
MIESAPVSEITNLILASKSPRRQQLLSLGGWSFNVTEADVDENKHFGEAPEDYVLRLAKTKARKSAEDAQTNSVIIAADTAVVDQGKILGKPADQEDATRMLKGLRGHTHRVYTGLVLLRVNDSCLLTDLTVIDVGMRETSDTEIETYVHSGDPLDKAGAYGIQDQEFHPVDTLVNCITSVMGLPLCRLAYLLGQFEIYSESGVHCETENQNECPVSSVILRGALAS